ncbi:uncharacterized protein EI90DRAFT_3095010 [Cantharellus anzutake]|uniref:uncharacterized protein n=1 Tax=Cantharellus anzutake TaxID=1750568 RepID=UPI0019056CE1|nr:uncharacterized protein EI90DRAFT_3095010 [Cantharellus anzutake]KAF8311929.1 hypothetical protein EI90DRAFT_3095010 [Cantharellus anzutake]
MKGLSELGIETLSLDVTKNESVRAAKEVVSERNDGKLHILVNNAGQPCCYPAVEIDLEHAQRMYDVNVFGVMRMVNEFTPLLIKAKGKILNLGSVAGIFPMGFTAAYGSAKAALHQYTDILRMELAPFGVSATAVVTGSVKSNIYEDKDPDLKPDSLYQMINDQYIANRKGKASMKEYTETSDYAKWFVEQTTKDHVPARLYKGVYSTRLWLFEWLLPKQFLINLAANFYGFNKLQERLDASEDKKQL